MRLRKHGKYSLKLYRGKWAVTWPDDGTTRRTSAGTADQAEAERFFEDFIAGLNAPAAQTVQVLWTAYLKEKQGAPAAKRMNSEWKALAGTFAHLEPRQITKDHCDTYTAARREKGRQDGTIWTELGDLATVLSWAEDRRYIDKAPRIFRPQKPEPRDRYLRDREIAALLDAAEQPHIRLAIIVLLTTAGRIGAVLDLTWDRVDFEHGHIKLSLDDGRRKKGRATVPMNSMAREALQEAKRAALSDHVVEYAGERVKSIRRGFATAVRNARLADVTPHVLRHTAAVHMAKAGVSMAMIAGYLGHQDDRITQRVYAKFAPEHMAAAGKALEFTERAPVQLNRFARTGEEPDGENV